MTRKLRAAGAALGIATLLAVALAGCAQTATDTLSADNARTAPTATPTLAPTTTMPSRAARPTSRLAAPTPTSVLMPTATAAAELDLVSLGKEVFQKTAGGVGCQYCHGQDASGGVGPGIIGREASEIAGALDRVEQMRFIFLEPREIEAVAAYLASIGSSGISE